MRSCRGSPWRARSGVGEELLGGVLLDDRPVGHEDDPVGGGAGEAHLVGDHDIVMPPLARSTMTSRTSLIISGSSAEVGSSKSITFGSIARARAIATRCCWPPESWAGYFRPGWRRRPGRAAPGLASRVGLALPRTLIGPRVTFSRIVLWANRLKLWKTIPTSARYGQRLALLRAAAPVEGDRSPCRSPRAG